VPPWVVSPALRFAVVENSAAEPGASSVAEQMPKSAARAVAAEENSAAALAPSSAVERAADAEAITAKA
jgi:hypothetical protein